MTVRFSFSADLFTNTNIAVFGNNTTADQIEHQEDSVHRMYANCERFVNLIHLCRQFEKRDDNGRIIRFPLRVPSVREPGK